MKCTTADFGNGVTAIVCRAKRPACTACKQREHTKLCDYPLAGAKAGKTCSVRLCDSCAVTMGDVDYCAPHAKVAREHDSHDRRAQVFAWCTGRFVDVADVVEFWTERAAIRQENGQPRWAAEELALRVDVVEEFGP